MWEQLTVAHNEAQVALARIMGLRFIVFSFWILLSLPFMVLARNEVMHLEAEDVQFFEVSAYDSRDRLMLHVSGLAFHSALAVNALEEIKENDSLHLLISLVPAKKGLSGSFDYTIEVPREINFVTFGDERKVVWERKRQKRQNRLMAPSVTSTHAKIEALKMVRAHKSKV